MKGIIRNRKKGNGIYCYYHYSYRVKINPTDSGKTRNTGKSKVITISQYLGTPENIYKKMTQSEGSSAKYVLKPFGLEAALLEIARDLEMPKILEECFPGTISGIKISDYLLVGIINRVCEPTPKTRIGEFVKKSLLGKELKIDHKKLTSANYWLAYDKIINEKELEKKRKEITELKKQKLTKALKKKIAEKELSFVSGMKKIDTFQMKLFDVLMEKENIHSDKLYIDSTNFYTYIENLKGSTLLCAKGKNKAGKNKLNQITVMMAIAEDYGIPLLHEIYKGNYNDMTLFPKYLTQLIENYVQLRNKVEELYICYDKGNNSNDNYEAIRKLEKEKNIKINVVGSLRGDHHKDLLRIPLKKYTSRYDDKYVYYPTKKKVFGSSKKIIITYSKKRAKRERKIFRTKLKKYLNIVQYYFESLAEKTKRKKTEEALKDVMEKRLVRYNPYKNIIIPQLLRVKNNVTLNLKLDKKKIRALYRTFGKTILFSSTNKLEDSEIITIYHTKSQMDNNHKILNCPKGVLFHPNWVWTDSKLKVQAFVNIQALTLFKLLEKRFNEKQSTYKLNAIAIKDILKEITSILVIKDKKKCEITTNELNSVEKKLLDIFNLINYLK